MRVTVGVGVKVRVRVRVAVRVRVTVRVTAGETGPAREGVGERERETRESGNGWAQKPPQPREDLKTLEAELAGSRTSFQAFVLQLESTPPPDLYEHIGEIKAHISSISQKEGNEWAASRLDANLKDPVGVLHTCPFHWSFQPDSFWRGVPDNPRLARIARSILTTGFRPDSVIASRTLKADSPFSLKFGDGSARGLAAAVVWLLLIRRGGANLPKNDTGLEHLLETLFKIPTSFEKHGDGGMRAALVAQAARQNQALYVLPLNTLEWVHLIVQYTGAARSPTRHPPIGPVRHHPGSLPWGRACAPPSPPLTAPVHLPVPTPPGRARCGHRQWPA